MQEKPTPIKIVKKAPKEQLLLEVSAEGYIFNSGRETYATINIYPNNDHNKGIWLSDFEEIDDMIVKLKEARNLLKDVLLRKAVAKLDIVEAQEAKARAKKEKAANKSN